MFSLINKILPYKHMAILLASLYIASRIYPKTQTKLANLVVPYKPEIVEMVNIVISILVGMATIGIIFIAVGFVYMLIDRFIQFVSDEFINIRWISDILDGLASLQYWFYNGGYLFGISVIWITFILLSADFLYLEDIVQQWYKVLLPETFKQDLRDDMFTKILVVICVLYLLPRMLIIRYKSIRQDY